jgi:hypothetical protein
MLKYVSAKWTLRLWLPMTGLGALGGCLSDQQLTAVFESVLTTALTTFVSQILVGITGTTTV